MDTLVQSLFRLVYLPGFFSQVVLFCRSDDLVIKKKKNWTDEMRLDADLNRTGS